MQLPDNILRAHTPTLDENIKGAINDKDMPRRSKWTAWCDVAQSVTGGLLAIFLFLPHGIHELHPDLQGSVLEPGGYDPPASPSSAVIPMNGLT